MNIKYITNQELKNAIQIAKFQLKSSIEIPMDRSAFEFREKLHEIILDEMKFGYMDFNLNRISAIYLYNTMISSTIIQNLPFDQETIRYAQTFAMILNEDPQVSFEFIQSNYTSDSDLSMFIVFIGIYCQFFDINSTNPTVIQKIKTELSKCTQLLDMFKPLIDQPKRYPFAKESHRIAIEHVDDIVQLTGQNPTLTGVS